MFPDTFCNSLNRLLDRFTAVRDDNLPSLSLRAEGVAIQNHSSQRRSLHLPQKQQGFLMPLAIFIVVIMGFFITTLSRTTSQTAAIRTSNAISFATARPAT